MAAVDLDTLLPNEEEPECARPKNRHCGDFFNNKYAIALEVSSYHFYIDMLCIGNLRLTGSMVHELKPKSAKMCLS